MSDGPGSGWPCLVTTASTRPSTAKTARWQRRTNQRASDQRQRVTQPSNEPEADGLLGGFFIGDYIEVFAHQGTALVHYNANYRKQPIIGEGFAINQQDNYLSRRGL